MAVAALTAEEKRLVRCDGCGAILSAEVAGLSVVTRRDRRGALYEWVGVVVSMRCACGTIWQPESTARQHR